MIKIHNLSKRFYSTVALENINLDIPKGSIFGIAGTNGAGKSTLLRLLAGVYKSDKANLSIHNISPSETTEIRNTIYFIPDTPIFFPEATPDSMALYLSKIYQTWEQKQYTDLLQTFSLNAKQKIKTMSKGMQKQVAFSLGMATAPEYLFLDELLDGLDPVMRTLFKSILVDHVAANSTTIILASHDLLEFEKLCDHIAFLHKGKIVISESLEDLKQRHFRARVLFQDAQDFDELQNELQKESHLTKATENGKLLDFTVVGDKQMITDTISDRNPDFFELLPLNLEEIFIYNMEVFGYDIKTLQQ